MYAEAGLQFPFMQGEVSAVAAAMGSVYQQHPQCFHIGLQDCGANLVGNMLQTSVVSEYDLGGEGDLFKAPEPIIEETSLVVDPMTAAISSMISAAGGDDAIAETIAAADIESIQNDHLNDVLYQCEKDLLEKSAIEESIAELLDVKIPVVLTDEAPNSEKSSYEGGQLLKSVSSECLSSSENIQGSVVRPNFLEFQGLNLEAALSMRRAYSDGDIQTLGNKCSSDGSRSNFVSAFEQHLSINDIKSEERRQKVSRYLKKKSERNFGRKIKYACRKALADSQPRVHGRFAKTEASEASKRCKQIPRPVKQYIRQNSTSYLS